MKRINNILALLFIIFVSAFCVTNNAYALINFALSSTATSSGYYSTSVPARAIDGDYTTIWDGGDHGTALDPNWLIVDLGEAKNVNEISLLWKLNDGQYPGYTNDYNFYTGMTGSDWTLQISGTFVDESMDPSDLGFVLDFGSSGLDMRYAKYEVVGGTHWSGVAEIEIFGDEEGGQPGSSVPEPATMLLFSTGLLGAFLKGRRV